MSSTPRLLFSLAAVLTVGRLTYASYNDGPERTSQVQAHFMKPAHVDFVDSDLRKIKLPAGFKINIFARGTGHSRSMIEDASGLIYISDPDAGEIYTLKQDSNQNVGPKTVIVSGIPKANGMILKNNKLYFVAVDKIYELDLKQKNAKSKVIVDQLPNGGQHGNRMIHEGPDGYLYVSIGSTCNTCDSPDAGSATLQKMRFDGSDRSVFARGLRDTMAFDWNPNNQDLYGVDNGVDWRGDEIPPEKLNLIQKDKDYGWPFCWGDRKPDPNLIDEPKNSTKAIYCLKTQSPVLIFPAHSAPIDLKFYHGEQFPKEYQNSAFLTMHGSWNRKHPSGYKVLRIFWKDGKPMSEDFMSGFLNSDQKSAFGRPAGLLVDRDGSLLVSDDEDGVIYRVSYSK